MILRELRRGIDVESPASGSKEFRRIRVCQLAAPHVPGRRKGTAISSVIAPRIPADAGRNAIGDVRDRRTGRSIATKGSRASGQNGRKMPPRRSPRETRSTTPFDTTGDVSRRRDICFLAGPPSTRSRTHWQITSSKLDFIRSYHPPRVILLNKTWMAPVSILCRPGPSSHM